MLNPPPDRDNGQSTAARQTAEALFGPKKKPLLRQPESAVAHKPRILAAQPPSRLDTASIGVSPTQETRRTLPKLQVDRIRTWLRYGMTHRQAADACGVSVSELKVLFDCAAVGDVNGETGRLAKANATALSPIPPATRHKNV